jgi:hypothetical protein
MRERCKIARPTDLNGLLGIAALMPLLELRLTPPTRTHRQKFSSGDLRLLRLCGWTGENIKSVAMYRKNNRKLFSGLEK